MKRLECFRLCRSASEWKFQRIFGRSREELPHDFCSGAAFSSEIIFKEERYDEKIRQMEGVCGGCRGGGIDGGLLGFRGQAG